MKYLFANLTELAERRARNVRQEVQIWDTLAHDLKRASQETSEPTFSNKGQYILNYDTIINYFSNLTNNILIN